VSHAGRIPSNRGKASAVTFLCSLVVVLFFLPRVATADGIRGFLEFDFNSSNLKTQQLTGETSSTSANAFTQRYNITLDKTLFPNLILTGGGQFQNDMQNSTTDGNKSRSNTTQISPNADLLWKMGTIFTDIGYRRREQKSETNGLASPTTVNETYTASLAMRPEGFPTLNIIFTRTFLYDLERVTQNSQNDTYSWGSSYNEVKGLDLGYSGTYFDQLNKLNGAETQTMSQGGRVAYSRQFLENRVSVASTYNLSTTETTFSSPGAAGTVFIPQLALNALFATTPSTTAPFITVTSGQLSSSFPAQINLVTPHAAPLPTTQINMGLSFANPMPVSTLFITVATNNPLPTSSLFSPQFSSFFSWDIYISKDGIDWGNKVQTITNAPFGHDPSNPASVAFGFILNVTPVTTQFIKVVETPPKLPFPLVINGIPVTDVNSDSILATGLQAFNTLTGTSAKSTSTGGTFGLNARALLLDKPNLSYDMSFIFNHSKSDQSAMTTQYTLINGLGLAHRFNEVFSASARVALENGTDTEGISRIGLTYNAALMANPLPTLSHTLVYSGRIQSVGGATDSSNSVYLNNTAELYKGLSVNAGAGISTGTNATGRNSQSTIINCSADIIPHRSLTVSVGFQDSMAKSSGGGQPDASTSTSVGTVSAAFRPFETVYLTGGYSVVAQTNLATATTQNYGVGWSPFRGGDLQFNFNYSESLSSLGNERTRSLSPTLRWNIRPGATLDFSYSRITTTSDTSGSTDVNSFSSALRISL
jgi:hypothetical protein